MTQVIKSKLTKFEACEQIVNEIEAAYTSECSPRSIGFNEHGEVDYGYIYMPDAVCIEIYCSEEWTLGDWDGDYNDPTTWTNETKSALVELFFNCWLQQILDNQDLNSINYEIEFASK